MLIETRFMDEALRYARLAAEADETPVGAVVVRDGEIVSAARNETEALCDPAAHAEMLAMKRACEALGQKHLEDCVLYVTMEPCPMCAGACLHYRIGAVAYGAYDARCGAFGSKADIGSGVFGRVIPVFGGLRREECAALLTEFFRKKRD